MYIELLQVDSLLKHFKH